MPQRPAGASSDALLTGELPCVTCGYELKGLSVRDVCPECGTAVRAAILNAVDPLADELAPLRAPSITGALIVAWALSSALGIWLIVGMRVLDGLRAIGGRVPEPWWVWNVSLMLLVISAISTLGFWAPTLKTRGRSVLCAAGATLAYAPFFYAMYRVRAIDLQQGGMASYYTSDPSVERIAWRLVVGTCLIAIFLGIRPGARELVRRSIAMRTGRVDRQTLLAMAAASGVAMVGDLLRYLGVHLGAPASDALVVMGALVVLIATVFLGIGMSSAVVDGWRIRQSLRMGPKRLEDIVTEPPEHDPTGSD